MQSTERRMVYLIRHGYAGKDGLCISATDIPLDDFGEHQAKRLAVWAAGKNLAAVCSSPLCRALSTAHAMTRLPVTSFNCLREADAGAWEGLTFDEIKKKYPEDYKNRGDHPGKYPPTNGESIETAGIRLLECLRKIIRETDGDIAVISHGGASRGALCRLLGRDPDEALSLPQPWGGISAIEVLADGRMSVRTTGIMPDKNPDGRSVLWLRERYKMPENIRLHCDAVAEKAVELARGRDVDTELLKSAAKLHDIARTLGSFHDVEGARLMRDSGYPALSEIIACHHDLPENAVIEAKLLYLADKLVQDDCEVSLHERFERSKGKCKTPKALEAWRRRYNAAVAVAGELGLEV